MGGNTHLQQHWQATLQGIRHHDVQAYIHLLPAMQGAHLQQQAILFTCIHLPPAMQGTHLQQQAIPLGYSSSRSLSHADTYIHLPPVMQGIHLQQQAILFTHIHLPPAMQGTHLQQQAIPLG